MFKNKKAFLAFFIAAALFFTGINNVSADESGSLASPPAMGILWVNVSAIQANLSFSGSTAYCDAYVVGKSGTTSITATVVLYRKNSNNTYTAIKTWTNLTSSGTSLYFNETHTITTGYTYKLYIMASVYRNGTSEVVTASDEAYAN